MNLWLRLVVCPLTDYSSLSVLSFVPSVVSLFSLRPRLLSPSLATFCPVSGPAFVCTAFLSKCIEMQPSAGSTIWFCSCFTVALCSRVLGFLVLLQWAWCLLWFILPGLLGGVTLLFKWPCLVLFYILLTTGNTQEYNFYSSEQACWSLVLG